MMMQVQRYPRGSRCSGCTSSASGSCRNRCNRGRGRTSSSSSSSDGSTNGERRRLSKYLVDIINRDQDNGILLTENRFSPP